MPLLLGAIADDLTGATDLANVLAGQGLRSVVTVGVPPEHIEEDFGLDEVEAVVVALKSRTAPVDEAVAHSLRALAFLRKAGAGQILFKYCSTFDSTPEGNIGPVTDALLEALNTEFTIACPALPENGRTVYNGHLFVHRQLLSDSPLRNHPLTPMTEANLVEVLAAQTPHRVGLVSYAEVNDGPEAIAAGFLRLHGAGYRHAIVDAIFDRDLLAIGQAAAEFPLITGGSGIALGLAANYRGSGRLEAPNGRTVFSAEEGPGAIVAGSCSEATLRQIEEAQAHRPGFRVDPCAAAKGEDVAEKALVWAQSQDSAQPLLIYASAAREELDRIQKQLGQTAAANLVESLLAEIARRLVTEAGVRRLVIAGGETSGAILQALGIPALRIGPQIDPGVPWVQSLGDPSLALALKSGNFGSPGFFRKAFEVLS
ncbi:MAG: 3-oxo-tetronate kinase [Rhodovibrionaceae bacterium]